MNKTFIYISLFPLLFLSGIGLPEYTNAQFINSRLEVEPELSVDVVQPLDFGEVVTGTGARRIEEGSSEMGIFEIRGLSNQLVTISLDTTSYLTHSNDDIDDQIPLSINASYTNTDNESIDEAIPFTENNYAQFMLTQTGSISNTAWQSIYVYIYGEINVGDVSGGLYEGVLVLTIECQ